MNSVLKLFLFISIIINYSYADAYDLKKFKKTTNSNAKFNLLKNPSFGQGMRYWQNLNLAGKILFKEGRNGGPAFAYERKTPLSYILVRQALNLAPARYEFGVWCKAENIKPHGAKTSGGTICVESWDKRTKKYITGSYLRGVIGTSKDWKLLKGEVNVTAGSKTYFTLYIERNTTGKAYFSDAFIRKKTDRWTTYIHFPANNVLNLNNPVLNFSIFNNAGIPRKRNLVLQLELKDNKKKIAASAPIKNGIAKINMKDTGLKKTGIVKCSVYVLDVARKQVLSKTEIPLDVRLADKQSVLPMEILPSGVTKINGKKFMPLGFYCSSVNSENIKNVLEAGGNTLLPYNFLGTNPTHRRLKKILDKAHKNNIKLICNVKDIASPTRWPVTSYKRKYTGRMTILREVVKDFKDHPAVLAWYMNDERPIGLLKYLIQTRQLINSIDPYHPAYGVMYQYIDLPYYGPSLDVLGIDPYPRMAKRNDMQYVSYGMTRAKLTNLPVWGVPEAFNNNVYVKGKKNAGTFKSPSEEDMRAYALHMAGMGAKGFIFYKLDDNYYPRMPKGYFEKFWPGMCRVFKVLRELEPYITSDKAAEKVPFNLKAGEVGAFELSTNDGKKVILLTSIRGGNCKAVLKVKNPGNWKSRYGHTKLINGQLIYDVPCMNSDILMPKK